jgi:hypothetical protein
VEDQWVSVGHRYDSVVIYPNLKVLFLLLFFALHVYSLPKSLQSNYWRHLEIRTTFDFDLYLLCKLIICGVMR